MGLDGVAGVKLLGLTGRGCVAGRQKTEDGRPKTIRPADHQTNRPSDHQTNPVAGVSLLGLTGQGCGKEREISLNL